MGVLTLLIFLMLAARRSAALPSDVAVPNATSAADAAAAAQAAAAAAAAKAARTGHPAHAHAAAQAAKIAKVLTDHAITQITQAKTQPPPWPQAAPTGLPSWPGGWTAAKPLPPAVVARSWQLLTTLWKSGAGTRKFENTGGHWYAYVATPFPGGKKGVTAWMPKPFIPILQSDQGPSNA